METKPKDLGAVAVAGNIKYEVLEHDAARVELRNILEADQYVLIDLEALHGIASILTRVAKDLDVIRSSDQAHVKPLI
jgi:hypothetical protein